MDSGLSLFLIDLLIGLASGIGAATADASCAAMASLSLGFISDLISRY